MSNYGEGRYAEAVRLFKSAHENLRICGEVSVEKDVRNQEILSNIGLAYVGAGMPDSSVPYFQQAIGFVSARKNAGRGDSYKWNEALSVATGNLGDAYSKLGMTDSAEWYFKESIVLSAHGNQNLQDQLYNRLKLADLYVGVGRRKEAFELLRSVDVMMADSAQVNRSCDVAELLLRRAGVLVRYSQSFGDPETAFAMREQFDSLREMKWARTKQLLNNSIAQGLDNAHHEKHILLLEKDMQIRGQQNVILGLAVVLAILAIVVIVRLLKDYRRRNAKLKVEAEEITRTSAEKEAMLQRKIRKDELNFMALIENTDDVLWSVDSSGVLLAFNKAFRDMVWHGPGDAPLVGQRFPGSVTEMMLAATIEEGYRKALGSDSFDIVEKVAVGDTGSTHIQLRFKAIKNEAGVVTGVSCFLRDITRYVKMIESLEEKNQRLRDIAWVQSHKLRGPLTTVMSILEFLESDDATHEQKKEMLAGLQAKVAEMDAIIHEIVSKTE
ncbi:MAG: tetratricopeptide repeat protein [Flavipsychrobacter sp.]|nr:tetratricopeptide repeat protein [Flavipsychrobacter sp.]